MPKVIEDRFAGRVALVTGGSSGLGRAMALRLAAEGASVAIGDLREDPREGGDPTHQVVADGGGQALHHSFDVTDEESVEHAFAATVDELGSLDVVICAAGVIGPEGDSLEIPFAEFEHTYRVNVFGTWLCNQAALRQFVPARGGKIVNLASNYGVVGAAGLATYCGSKAAVIGMTKSLAVEFGQYGININALCPGAAATEINAHLRERKTSRSTSGSARRSVWVRKDATLPSPPRSPVLRSISPPTSSASEPARRLSSTAAGPRTRLTRPFGRRARTARV